MDLAHTSPARLRVLHPVHAVLLAGMLPLFLGALLGDWAYSNSFDVQWINFAAWLNAGAMVFAGGALLWAVVDFLRRDVARDGRSTLFVLSLVATFVIGFVAALQHAKDAGATMPGALIFSVLSLLLAAVSVWLGFSTLRSGAGR